jgi:transposase
VKDRELDDLWPLSQLAEDFNVSERQITNWAHKRDKNGFPEPKKSLGRYHLYSYQEVREWFILYKRVTARMGRGKELNERA